MARWIKPVTRLAIYARDGFRCAYCNAKRSPIGDGLTLDHVEPRERFGSNEHENLVTACIGCNRDKHARGVVEWLRDAGRSTRDVRLISARVRRRLSRPVRFDVGRAIALALRSMGAEC